MLLDTTYKRKSLVITTVIMILLLLIMWLVGMTYYTPAPEVGIAVSLGDDSFGMGKEQRYTPIKRTSVDKIPEPPVEEPVTTAKLTPFNEEGNTSEEVVTQNLEESVVVTASRQKKPKQKQEKAVLQEKAQQKQTPSAQTQSVLSSIFNADAKTDASAVGKGSTTLSGNSGKANANPYASSFYGSGAGTVGSKGKGWGLNGRNLLEGEKVLQNCNEEGTVVVQIEVNKAGQVVRSKPGVRGTTNTAPCLLQAAKATAQTYKWNYDDAAPQIQVGFIVINFKLGE